MKIKNGFVLRKVANQYMAVPVGTRAKELHGMIALNETGAFFWEQLQSDRTKEELVSALLAEYEVDENTASNSVERFVKELREQGVLEDE